MVLNVTQSYDIHGVHALFICIVIQLLMNDNFPSLACGHFMESWYLMVS